MEQVGASAAVALTIGASDSTGASGLQADLRAFAAARVHGTSAVCLVTAQGTRGVHKVFPVPSDVIRAQIETVFDDLAPRAVKTGALGNASTVEIVADVLRSHAPKDLKIVVDPVVNPTRGRSLLDDSGLATLARELLPLATLVMPNRDETSRLAGRARGLEDARRACRTLADLGAGAVLIKGGHFTGNDAVDLFYDGRDFVELRAPRRQLPFIMGLGCTFSGLVTAFLARGDRSVLDAVRMAHAVVQRAMDNPRALANGVYALGSLQQAISEVQPTVVTVPRGAASTPPAALAILADDENLPTA
ncbi:MAG: bifunctional hydroxymethylpyrimidine kinase/phosphomethylpyrimidine kinase [Deltaproteobacteria bacterium]|nr:bifunctional hydroxymethylpyrimidine kinase/phosphomethylpyrimidine kinase [Deltaproteobacteria bacterium]